MASRVVPGSSETMTRSSPRMAFKRLDFPALGRPTMASRMPATSGSVSIWRTGSLSQMASRSSSSPLACSLEVGMGSPKPRP